MYFGDHVFSILQIIVTVAYEIMIFYISCILIWYDDICVSGGRDRVEPEALKGRTYVYICLCLCLCVSEEGTGLNRRR